MPISTVPQPQDGGRELSSPSGVQWPPESLLEATPSPLKNYLGGTTSNIPPPSKKRKKKSGGEKDVLRSLIQWLQLSPNLGVFWRNNQNSSFFRPELGRFIKQKGAGYMDGTPDIIGVLWDGTACFIEAKQKGSYQSPAQREFEKRVTAHGAKYLVARSVDDLNILMQWRETWLLVQK